ncbi:hypothetical protein [Pseudonocardia nigra]|uniref:hypothetical protein n=1 Tax=Pseudonocardia nigra TaxID=1921578 RepID=UPI001C601491|nr:hypothetical protein [Pseudonocardia nigra]
MKTIRTAFAAAALATVLTSALTSCGGQVAGTPSAAEPAAAPPPATSVPATPPSGTADGSTGSGGTAAVGADDEAAVEIVFRSYYRALLDRDWQTACALSAPETQDALIENLRTQGGVTVGSCEEAFSTIYAVPGAAEIADEIAETAQIQDIAVTGDDATITWSAQSQGARPTVINGLRRIDGEWRLLDVTA